MLRRMTTIIVHQSLLEGRGSGDRKLERRIWLADRIRRYARESLGPRFVDVEMVSKAGVPGPSTAVFLFEPWPGAERDADEADRRQVVKEFVASLGRP